MADNTAPQALTPGELKEIQDFLKSKNVDIQINIAPQQIRRMEDGGLVIDPPKIQTQLVKIQSKKAKLETA